MKLDSQSIVKTAGPAPVQNKKKGCGLPAVFFMGLYLLTPVQLCAGLITNLALAGYSSFIHTENYSFPLAAWGISELMLQAAGNDNLRGEFQLDTLLAGDIRFSVPRAYLALDLDAVRFTLGKTRLSWGEGLFFNAGDLLFGEAEFPVFSPLPLLSALPAFSGLSSLAALPADTIRIATDWLAAGYLALTDYSFLEAVVLPHPRLSAGTGAALMPGISSPDWGGRIVVDAGAGKMEAGYMYQSGRSCHWPYLAFRTSLAEWDWYTASRLVIPYAAPDWEVIRESWQISLGLFRRTALPDEGTISWRLETALKPFGTWQELSPSPPPSAYGLYVFSDIILSNDTLSYELRALYSPLDNCLLQTWSVRWSGFKDFSLNFFLTLMLGDSDDLFRLGQAGDITFTISSVFSFGTGD